MSFLAVSVAGSWRCVP